MPRNPSRFTAGQITTIVVAVAVAIVAFPIGVFAATGSLVNITDPVTKSHKARVDASGRLLVDAAAVARPAAPAKPWRYANENVAGLSDVAVGPTAQTINVTSLSVSTQTDGLVFTLTALFVPGAATDCSAIQSTSVLYGATHIAIGAPLTASFPTPLQVRPPTGKKVCLWFQAPAAAVDLSGYFGS